MRLLNCPGAGLLRAQPPLVTGKRKSLRESDSGKTQLREKTYCKSLLDNQSLPYCNLYSPTSDSSEKVTALPAQMFAPAGCGFMVLFDRDWSNFAGFRPHTAPASPVANVPVLCRCLGTPSPAAPNTPKPIPQLCFLKTCFL